MITSKLLRMFLAGKEYAECKVLYDKSVSERTFFGLFSIKKLT